MSETTPTGFEGKRRAHGALDTIWIDGAFRDWEDAQVHVLSHALHYGTSVFEGVRCYDTVDGPALFRWDAHLDRFYDSAAVYDIDVPYDRAALTAATKTLIRRQDLGSCYVRPIAFFGYDRLGVNPTAPTPVPVTVALACWPWEAYFDGDAATDGIDVTVSAWRKYASDRIPTTAKTAGAYVNGVLATQEASRDGYDEALLLNGQGNVAEGPGENLFLVRDGKLYTPGLSEGVLDGVTRRSVIEIARDLGYTVDEHATISRGELHTADELFFSGTAVEVTPIRSVDGDAVGEGTPGPVTAEIQSRLWSVLDGEVDAYSAWLTPVE